MPDTVACMVSPEDQSSVGVCALVRCVTAVTYARTRFPLFPRFLLCPTLFFFSCPPFPVSFAWFSIRRPSSHVFFF